MGWFHRRGLQAFGGHTSVLQMEKLSFPVFSSPGDRPALGGPEESEEQGVADVSSGTV